MKNPTLSPRKKEAKLKANIRDAYRALDAVQRMNDRGYSNLKTDRAFCAIREIILDLDK